MLAGFGAGMTEGAFVTPFERTKVHLQAMRHRMSEVSIMLGPNPLIFSFSSGASLAQNAGGRVLSLFNQQIFLMKEVDKRDGKMIISHYPPLLKCPQDRHIC